MVSSVDLTVTEPQAAFLALDCKYPAFVGGFGSGKSETMTTAAVIDLTHSSSCVVAMYEPTFDLVTLMLAPRMEAKLAHFGITYNYNKQDHIIYTSSSQVGDIVFRSADKPERIIAYESYRAHVDELDTLKTEHAREVWRKILGRNRQNPKDLPNAYKVKSEKTGKLEACNKASVYTTPEGYRFVYDRWKKRGWNPETGTGDRNYQIIQADTRTNPFNPPGYVESLFAEYPEALVEAYVQGKFTNLTSGTVYNAYDRERCKSNETIQPKEDLFIGCDFNVQRMCYTVYVKRDAGRQWHAVDEGHNLYNTADVVRSLTDRYLDNGHRLYIYPDCSGASRKSSAAQTDIQQLEKIGYMRANKKNPDVRDRVACMNKALEEGRVFVNHHKCPNVANCLEQQAYDKKGEPEKDGKLDDQNDASTYPIAYELPIRRPVFKIDFDFTFCS
tara:strand:+ start:4950 stop:6281 length:1332 start_codon:yes stop_codon:yes gene_type:complete